MNHVERFRKLMSFEMPDRLPRIEWATWWDKTITRWHAEGLPETLAGSFEISRHFDLDPYFQAWFSPRAETYPNSAGHGKGTVADAGDYDALKKYLFPPFDDAIERLKPWAEKQERGEAVVWITLEGFFWFPRTLFGIENHFYAFYDHPDLMQRMNQDLADYHAALLEKLAAIVSPVFMTFAEDMSYNNGPMLSKALFDEFLAPYYRQVVPLLRDNGCLVLVDSDGDVTEMIPWLQDAGIQGILPLERQAGVDAAAIREAFPDFRMIGHFDKMTLARGEDAVRAEFERLLPVLRTGGFIPSVDHQTPPNVSLDQYRTYLKLLEEYSVKAVQGSTRG